MPRHDRLGDLEQLRPHARVELREPLGGHPEPDLGFVSVPAPVRELVGAVELVHRSVEQGGDVALSFAFKSCSNGRQERAELGWVVREVAHLGRRVYARAVTGDDLIFHRRRPGRATGRGEALELGDPVGPEFERGGVGGDQVERELDALRHRERPTRSPPPA